MYLARTSPAIHLPTPPQYFTFFSRRIHAGDLNHSHEQASPHQIRPITYRIPPRGRCTNRTFQLPLRTQTWRHLHPPRRRYR
ncbi:hypothetical protein [Rubritalea tangerina]|uniref:hypothetical protein n=1 Tax=Rubritalea tangerina TaxID=430798 RepID=UPI0036084C4A